MADKNDGGDKTEKPTPKRLEDARKKGDVAKSKELPSAAGLVLWLVLGALLTGFAVTRIAALWESLFATLGAGWDHGGYAGVVRSIGWQASELTLLLVAVFLVPVAAFGLLIDFLQTGPVFTFEKLKPKLDHMNPVEGVKRMFTLDNLIELAKSIAKTALLFLIGWLVVRAALPEILGLARSARQPVQAIGALVWDLTLRTTAWTIGVFAMVALLDTAYQRFSFTKKMRMSLRDIKQEMKESEGDPYIKGQRKQMHQEWSQQSAAMAARGANVLVVNPTHVAIAIDYDRESCPVPCIAAKGEDEVARAMRAAAEEAGVPIVRNIPLARDLLARGEIGAVVPQDLFEIIAEVILWAREVRDELDAERHRDARGSDATATRTRVPVPGEDLTRYPDASQPPPWNPLH